MKDSHSGSNWAAMRNRRGAGWLNFENLPAGTYTFFGYQARGTANNFQFAVTALGEKQTVGMK